MEYIVEKNSYEHLTISGKDVDAAVESGISSIVSLYRIGNEAGATFDRAWFVPAGNVLELHILAHGSDLKVNYDPTNDPAQEYVVRITGVPETELVAKEIEIRRNDALYDPFSDLSALPSYARLGTFVGLCDEISVNHCRIHEDCPVSLNIASRFPNMVSANTPRYISLMLHDVNQRHPLDDAETQRLMSRAEELSASVDPHDKDVMSYCIYKAKTSVYFDQYGKITCLQYYRQRAGLTQAQLAEKVGISARQVQNYESQTSRLGDAKYGVVVKIAETIGCEPKNLVTGSLTNYVRETK